MPMQQVMSYAIKLPYKMRCQLPDCQVAKNDLTQIAFDDKYKGVFCGTPHAQIAMERWIEKVQKGIKPGRPVMQEEMPAEAESLPNE